MRKNSVWTHKKHGSKKFSGHYIRVDGERQFQLKLEGGGNRIAFESFQAAKSAGWVKKS